jgi:acetyl esterase/lipase
MNQLLDIVCYEPSPDGRGRRSGASILILPGGGYSSHADHEGEGYAQWFSARGIVSYVLNYRLGSAGHRHPAPLEDATQALRQIRARARKRGEDAAKVGVIGSSAGGHLAATLLTQFNSGDTASRHPVLRESSRPDFGILCYPVITMETFTHTDSRDQLLGVDANPELLRELSAENNVTPATPPTFIWHTGNDSAVSVENSLLFAGALRRAGVPFELHVYEQGAHGLGLPEAGRGAPPWDEALAAWLQLRGVLL